MTKDNDKSKASQDPNTAGGFRGNLSANDKNHETIDGKTPQVGGLTEGGKHANMPGTDYSKVQKSEHVEAVQDKIEKDGLLSGKPSGGHFETKTKADAEKEDAENKDDKNVSDDKQHGSKATDKQGINADTSQHGRTSFASSEDQTSNRTTGTGTTRASTTNDSRGINSSSKSTNPGSVGKNDKK